MPRQPSETLEQWETRLIAEHEDRQRHFADDALDLRYADDAIVAAFERQHGLPSLVGSRWHDDPFTGSRLPPTERRSNDTSKSCLEMTDAELRDFEKANGLSHLPW